MDLHDVIDAVVVSEKSIAGTAERQFTFRVHPGATKTQIRDAVSTIFKVNVERVNTVSYAGKRKTLARRGARIEGARSDWKKAIVTLREGQTIELNGVNPFHQ